MPTLIHRGRNVDNAQSLSRVMQSAAQQSDAAVQDLRTLLGFCDGDVEEQFIAALTDYGERYGQKPRDILAKAFAIDNDRLPKIDPVRSQRQQLERERNELWGRLAEEQGLASRRWVASDNSGDEMPTIEVINQLIAASRNRATLRQLNDLLIIEANIWASDVSWPAAEIIDFGDYQWYSQAVLASSKLANNNQNNPAYMPMYTAAQALAQIRQRLSG